MRNKVLFIVPPSVAISELIPDEGKTFNAQIRKDMPLGVLSLATYVEAYTQAVVTVLDLNEKFYDLVKECRIDEKCTPEKYIHDYIIKLKQNDYDFCGISAIFSASFGYLSIISKIIKEVFPKSIIFTGGGSSSFMKETFDCAPCIDVISYGEGELAIAGFIRSQDEQQYLEDSLSLMTREKMERGFQCSFEFIENLDEIPTLDLSLVNFESYINRTYSQNKNKIIAMPLMFSRGCPFNCCFCSSHSIHGKRVRYNSLERIKLDIQLFVKKYNVNTILVWDDNFFVDKDKAISLLDYFMELNLTVEFSNGFPVYRIDDELVKCLKKSGVNVVTLAIESGNPRVLKDIIHKPLKLEMVPKAIECLKKYDIYAKGLFVIGFPGETLEDIQMSMDFIHNSDLNWVSIYAAAPLPGSELYDVCREGGYLKKGALENLNYWSGNIETENFRAEQIEEIQIYNTIKKDYVYNVDMLNENYERALFNFELVIKENYENPFAYYYASKAAKKIGMNEKAEAYYDAYINIRHMDKKWEKLFEEFSEEVV